MNTNLPAEIPKTPDGTPITEAFQTLRESGEKVAPEGEVKVIYVNNPFNPHHHEVEYHSLSKSNHLADVIPDGLNPHTTVASVNGKIYEAEEWHEVGLHSQDSVVIVQTPAGGDDKSILRIIAIIVIAVAAPYLAPGIGGAIGVTGEVGLAIIEVGIVVAGAMLVTALLPPAMPDMGNAELDSSPSYGLDGAKNTSEEGIPMPIVYGQFRMAGNIVNLHTRNSGNNQFVYMLVNAGEGPISSITGIEINENDIANFQDVEEQIRLGTPDQTVMEWFQDTITPTAVGVTLSTTHQTRTTSGPVDRFRVDFVAPGGLAQFNDQGDRQSRDVNFEIQYRVNGSSDPWTSLSSASILGYNATYVYFGYENYDDDGNLLSTVPETTSGTLGPGEFLGGPGGDIIFDSEGNPRGFRDDRIGPIYNNQPKMTGRQTSAVRASFWSPLLPTAIYDVRCRRIAPESTDPKIVDGVNWTDLNDIIHDDVTYKNTALLGIRIRLTDQISSLPNVTFLHGGKNIKYRTKNGNWINGPGNSPAWVAWDMLTNTRYGGAIPESRMDKDKFIEWSDYCETVGLTFNGIYDTRLSLWDALMHVYRAGHARPIMLGTKYSVAIDQPGTPSQMFSSGNIIKDSYSQRWLPMTDRANEVDVSYFDANDRHKRRTVKVYDDAVAAGAKQNTASVTLFGITDATRATEEAIFLLKNNRLVRSTVTFRAPLEAIAVTVGDLFQLQHEQPNLSKGGRLAAGSTSTTLELDRPFTFDGAKSYKALVRHDSQDRYSTTITNGNTFLGINRIELGVGYAGETDVNRIRNGSGAEATITRFDPTFPQIIWVDDATGFSELEAVTLFQTDAIEEVNVTAATSGTLTSVPLASAMQQTGAEHAIWMIGEVALVDSVWRVTKMNVESDQTVTITGAEYNVETYNWNPSTGAVVNPDSDYSTVVPHVTNLSAALTDILIGNVLRPAVDISWDLPADFENYAGAEIQIATDGGAYITVGQVTDGGTYYQHEVGIGQNLVVRVVAMSADGRYALRSSAPTAAVAVIGNQFAPQDPTAFQVAVAQAGLTLSWTNPGDADFAGCEIKRNTVADEPSATLIYITEPKTIQYSDLGADNGSTAYFYWIRAFDTDGNFSNWVASSPASATPTVIASGTDATTGFLTNEAHVVPSAADGSSPNFSGANGIFKTFKGLTENSPTSTFSVLGADNTTVTINTAQDTPVVGQPAGYYEVTAETVAQDIHSVNLRAVTSDAITIDKIFTLTKSKAGIDGTDAKLVRLSATTQAFSYDNSTGTPSLIGPASIVFTVSEQNTTGATTWQVFDHTGAEITPVTNVLSSMSDTSATMLETAFVAQTNNNFLRVRATREGISDDFSVFELFSGQDGADGLTAKTVQIEAPSQIFAYDNATGTPVLIGPTQIVFGCNRQNITGGTSWTLEDSLGGDVTASLSGATNTSVTLTEAAFAAITNNTFVKLTATADGISDSVTIVELISGQDGAEGTPGTPGDAAHNGFLTNEAHVVAAAEDGTGYTLVGAGGTFKVFDGITDVTTSAIFNITGGTDNGTNWTLTQNGLTLTLQETTGVYDLTGASWTSDQESFTMTATHGGVTITKTYTISKSKTGATGPTGAASSSVALSATAITFSYDNSTGTPALIGPSQIDFTLNRQNIIGNTTWALEDSLGADQTAKLTGTGNTARTLTEANFATITNNDYVKLTATADGLSDTVTIAKLVSGQDGTAGVNAVSGYLTNETHLVAAANDGTGYSLTGSGGTLKIFDGTNDVTTSSTFSIVGGTDQGATWTLTQNGLTLTLNETTGVYTLAGATWLSDEEQFTLQGTFNAVTVQKVYTISKSRAGTDGGTGADAKTIRLSSDAQAFTFDGTGSASPASQTITFTASRQNIPTATSWATSPVVTLGGTGDTRTLAIADFGANTAVEVTASSEGFEDKITVIRIEDGAAGAAGDDAITGYLTNETHNVTAANDGTGYSLTGAGGTFKVWDGITDVTTSSLFSIIGGVDGGTTWSKTQNGLTLTLNETSGIYSLSGASWTTDQEQFTLEAVSGAVTIQKIYVITKSREGAAGPTGNAGADAKLIKLTADAQAFTYNGAGAADPSSQTINLTSVRQNIATATTWATVPVVTLGGTGDNRTLAIADFGANTSVEVTASSEGFEDKITIYRVQDGATGGTGAAGDDAISGFLTNEAHLVAALNDGTGYVLTGAGGTFTVYDGITDVTTSATFSIIGGTDLGATWEKTQNGLTMTVNETLGTYNLSGATWTSDEEQFTLQATFGGVTIQKIYVITKSKTGGDGAAGAAGAPAKSIALSSDAQAFTYDGTGAASPGAQTITFTANRQNIASATAFATSPVVTLGGTGDTRTLTVANFGANTAVEVTASAEGLEDKITVVRIQDGATGATGGTGAAGDDAHVGLLTNESHTVPTLADGTGYSLTNAGGTFKVWDGITDVTTSSLFSIVGGTDNGTNWTLTQNGLTLTIQETTGVYTLSGGSWTTDAEAFTMRATHGGVTIDRQYVITKAIAGATGPQGPQGAAGRDGIVVAAVRINNNTFTVTNNGSMYIHGLDGDGNPADVNGTAFYDGTLITVPKQHVDTSQDLGTGYTGFLVMDRSTASFTVSAVARQIAAAQISNPSAGVIQWQYDNGSSWVNFTPTQNHIIIGFYETTSANLIETATITAPMPMSTATVNAASIKTSTLSAISATIGNLETRANTGGVGNTTPRLVLNNSTEPMVIYDEDDSTKLFGITDLGSSVELYLKGNFALNSLSSFSGFNDTAMADLRGRLGITEPSAGTGGSCALAAGTLHTAGTGTYQNYDLNTGEPINSGGLDITLTFNMSDFNWGTGTGPTVASYTYIWQWSTNNSTFNDIAGSGGTFSGSKDIFFEDTVPPSQEYSYSLNVTRSYVWTGSTGTSGTPVNYYFRLRVRQDSGTSFNDKVNSATANEPLSGNSVAAHSHNSLDITDFDTEVANNSAVVANTAKVSNATHTGDATGSTALTLQPSAITAKTALTSGLAGTDELLVSDAGVLKRMDVSVMNAYFNSNLSFAATSHNHSASNITSGTLAVARGGTGVTSSTGTGSVVLSSSPSISAPTITGSTVQGTTNFQDSEVNRPWLRDFAIRHQSISATTATTTINYSSGQSVLLTLSSTNTTVSVSNWPVSGRNGQIQIEIKQGTTPRTITWTGVTWVPGSAPDISSASATYFVHLTTNNGGSTIWGSYANDNATGTVTSFNSRTGSVVPASGDYAAYYAQKGTTTPSNSSYLYTYRSSTSAALFVRQASSGNIAQFFVSATSGATSGTNQITFLNSGRVRSSSGFEIADANTLMSEGASNSMRVTTNSGYHEIGPNNTSWAHNNTDRANFYFNKGAHFNGICKRYTQGAMPWYASSTYASAKISVQTTAPTSPATGDIWFDTS